MDGVTVAAPAGTVPSNARSPTAAGAAGRVRPSLASSQFLEGGTVEIQSAQFVRSGAETVDVTTPWGAVVAGCTEVQLVLDGRPGNVFCCRARHVIKSDWGGAESYATTERERLLGDLGPDVRGLITTS